MGESITNIERGRYYRNRFHEISEKWIREHRQDYRGNRTGDLQDAYLVKVNAGEETFTEQGLAAILRELFVIGSESESVMMRWAVRIIACYPDVQEKVRAELEAACGRGVEIVWDKRTQLPLATAAQSSGKSPKSFTLNTSSPRRAASSVTNLASCLMASGQGSVLAQSWQT